MPDVVIYLVKANIALVLFYFGYLFLLRRLTFYNLNRLYLLFGLMFSAFYPFVDLTEWAAKREHDLREAAYVLPVWEPVPAQGFDAWPYVVALFWLISIFFLVRLGVRLFSLWGVHRASVASQWKVYRYRQVYRYVNPFSFWRNIYVNVHQYEDVELSDIFHHEQVHVEGYHTLDILVVELLSVLCWFNPGAWFYRHAVRENLEFITDRKVLQNGADRKTYQYSLLRTGAITSQPSLGANFNLRSIRRRIMMMNKKKSSKLQIGKYLLAIPIIAVFVLVFTITKAYQDEHQGELTPGTETVANEGGQINGEFGERHSFEDNDIHEASRQSPTAILDERVTVTDTVKKENLIALRGADSKGDKPLFILDGVRMDKASGVERFSLDGLDPNFIESIEVLKGKSGEAIYGEAGKNGVVLITTVHKGGNSVTPQRPKGWVNDMKFNVDSSAVSRKDTAISTTDSSLSEVVVVGYSATDAVDSAKNNNARVVIRGRQGDEAFQDALFVVDGQEVSKRAFDALNPNDIYSMEVLKGRSATEKYGKKGEKGVIEIRTNSKNK